jgi:hypothetical protein
VFGPMGLRLSRLLQQQASIWDQFNNGQHWCATPGVRPLGPEALQGRRGASWCSAFGPEALQGVPAWGDNLDQINMGSIGAPSLVFGPSGLRLSRAGAALPGVRPYGPEALQGVPAEDIKLDQLNMVSFGAPSLVFGPTGLRLSRAGAALPGVRPHGPEALQEASTLGVKLAISFRRLW